MTTILDAFGQQRTQTERRVDRHSASQQRERNRLLRGLHAVLHGLGDLRIEDNEVQKIRALLEPYIQPIKRLLGGPPMSVDIYHDVDPVVPPSGEQELDLADEDDR